MKIKILVTLLGVIIVLAGLAIYWQPEEIEVVPVPDQTVPATESDQSVPLTGSGTLHELAERGQNLECTVTYKPVTGSEITGSYFVGETKVRGDFVTASAELGQVLTSYINDGESIYVWSEINGESYGVVTTLAKQELIATQEPIPKDAKVHYQCSEWKQIDNSIFVPPAGVLFKEAVNADMEYGTVYEAGEFPF